MWAALWVLSVAAASGAAVAGLLALPPRRWMAPAALAHGLAGLLGAALLVPAALRLAQAGAAGEFGLVAVVSLGLAALLGLGLGAARLARRRPPVLVVGLHATVAFLGYLVLVAYLTVQRG